MRDVRNLTLRLRILVTTGALLPLALALQPIAPATGGGMVDEQSSAEPHEHDVPNPDPLGSDAAELARTPASLSMRPGPR